MENRTKSPQRWLALDTSTPDVALALVEHEQVKVEHCFWSGTGHSEQILAQIEAALALVSWRLEDLEAIVIGRGPGSFTGLRVGVATAQGLAWALGIPLVGVSSLDAWAWSAPMAATSWVVACVDARKDQVYAGFYRLVECQISVPFDQKELSTLQETDAPCALQVGSTRLETASSPLLVSPWLLDQAMQRLPSPLLVGTGASVLCRVWNEKGAASALWPALPIKLRGSALVALAQREIEKGHTHAAPWSVLPAYIRAADAELHTADQHNEDDAVWFAEEIASLRDVLFPADSSR